MAHCFLSLLVHLICCRIIPIVTLTRSVLHYSSYSASESSGWNSKGLVNWAPPPALVNVAFSCLPICIIAGITGAIVRGAAGYGIILIQTRKTLDLLSQGTSVWKQLQKLSDSEAQKALLLSDLARVQGQLKNLNDESGSNLNRAMHYHHWTNILYLVFICVTCLVRFPKIKSKKTRSWWLRWCWLLTIYHLSHTLGFHILILEIDSKVHGTGP